MIDNYKNIRKSLHCNTKNCRDCLLCIGENPYTEGMFICEKFGDRTEHGLILAKFCDLFLCKTLENETGCLSCRGYLGQYEEE